MNISYKIGDGTFNYRVAGVLIYERKVLLATDQRTGSWYLPGGRVEIFESSAQALEREMVEELAVTPIIDHLLWVSEGMFSINSWGNVHELCFYYLMSLPNNSELYQKESFEVVEVVDDTNKISSFKWFDIATINQVDFKPAFIKERINALPDCLEHIVINEMEKYD